MKKVKLYGGKYKTETGYLNYLYKKNNIQIREEHARAFMKNKGGEITESDRKRAFREIVKTEKEITGKRFEQVINRVKRNSYYSEITPERARAQGFTNILKKAGIKIRDEKGRFMSSDKFTFKNVEAVDSGKYKGKSFTLYKYKDKYILQISSPKNGTGSDVKSFNDINDVMKYLNE